MLPVIVHGFPGILQLLVGQQQVPGVRHSEEMTGSSHKSALVPSRLLDVDVWWEFSRHGRGLGGTERQVQ